MSYIRASSLLSETNNFPVRFATTCLHFITHISVRHAWIKVRQRMRSAGLLCLIVPMVIFTKGLAVEDNPQSAIGSKGTLNGEANASELSQEIETLKQAMINLNRDLFILEEDLLFPSSTQVAVYMAMDVGQFFKLDAVELKINSEVKTYYLYTDRQLDALFRGGVQKLYVGNLNQGEHELTAFFIGIGPENREYKRAVTLNFTKDEEPLAIELNVQDSELKQQPIFTATTL